MKEGQCCFALRQSPVCKDFAEEMIRLLKNLSENFVEGRIELDYLKPGMYANVQVYQTRSVSLYEDHEHFIDVQCVLEGQEEVELCPVSGLSVLRPYNKEQDITFYDGATPPQEVVVLRAGQMIIVPPNMGHKPCLNHEGVHRVKKVVFKVPL